MPLMGLLIDWTWLKKEPVNLRIYQEKPPKLKSKEDKDGEKRTDYSRNVGQLEKV